MCSSEWPTFEVGWPQKGSFDLSVVVVVQWKVFGAGSAIHLNQAPYIVVWRDLLTDSPSWIQGFLPNRILVLQAQTSEPDQKKEVLQNPGTANLLLLDPSPLYPPALLPSVPPTPQLAPSLSALYLSIP